MLGSVTVSLGQPASGLSSFDWIALYAAVVATGALVIEIHRWWTSGVQLDIRLMPHAHLFGAPDQDREWLSVTVINIGDRPTIISDLHLIEHSLYRRIVRRFWYRHIRAGVLQDAAYRGGRSQLPGTLQSGGQWVGLIEWEHVAAFLEQAKDRVYVGVSSNDRRFARLVRIKLDAPAAG